MTHSIEPKFVHQFIPATQPNPGITLLLLHGTGGNEQDLLPLGRELLPGAALLSPRGRVLENGMPRFFRRFQEGVFDVDDLKFQTNELNDFLKAAAQQYGVGKNKMVAVGYSNGANIAASLVLLHPTRARRGSAVPPHGAVYARFCTQPRAHFRASQRRHARPDCSA